ncbi:Aspartokinase II/homoserine dehydrogenase II [Kluyvera cryocrescens]|uniref:Aspartokinase II/homoserine dehydrogenase II n=1 Tax=Kluyvera cryocrescens TaxID=580 RepID=A0A485B4C0_KLUCR|nr:Aspartokinase II/homoserine dehydrogenase II [Kluyvera cryocrescens]
MFTAPTRVKSKMPVCCRCCVWTKPASWRVWRHRYCIPARYSRFPGSDIDLQLRCSYTPDQGSTRIERVLASGTGARIVTSHDDVCLIEFRVPGSQDFKLAHKEIDQLLKRAQIRPLAVGIHADHRLLQFCYTSEVADSALRILDEAGLPGELRLRQGLALVAMVGGGRDA